MQELKLNVLLEIAKETGRLSEVFSNWKPSTDPIPQESQTHNKKALAGHAETFGELGLHMCRLKCEAIAEEIDNPASKLASMFADLAERMFHECQLRFFVSLSVHQAELAFPTTPLFGKEVETQFPSAAFEIEEAGKCLGLSRPTAAVFHCMRSMEMGIAAVSRCLGIADPVKPAERNWAIILKKIMEDGVKVKWPTAAARLNGDGAFFEDVYVTLDAVRNPWRNATMHVENKYTDEEAEHILIAVRGFMKKVASRMDENGEPKCP